MGLYLPAFLVAVAIPWGLAYNTSPSTTALNQLTAVLGWGVLSLSLSKPLTGHLAGRRRDSVRPSAQAIRGPFAALLLLAAIATWCWAEGGQAFSIAASALATLVCAAITLQSGRVCATRLQPSSAMRAFFGATLIGALISAFVALVQVFAPSWPDGTWVAHSAVPGRAVGNLRQANHLSTLLLWGAIALIGLMELSRSPARVDAVSNTACISLAPVYKRLIPWLLAIAVMNALVHGVVLTASRTGLIGVGLLALWGLLDQRLSRGSRWLLMATLLLYAVGWGGMAWWAEASAQTFGGQQRLAEGDISGSRFRIWADALQLIATHPWAGVGWGNFNFAWSLTPFPNRHTAFFDHTHNFPLQLAVELGLPIALLICGLLLWGLWQAWRRALAAEPAPSAAGRCAVMMVVLIGLHSLLEYPLWYTYFLLPTAFVWGFALGLPRASTALITGAPSSTKLSESRNDGVVIKGESELRLQTTTQHVRPAPEALHQNKAPETRGVATGPASVRSWPLATAGTLCVAGAVFSVFDYLRVVDIFAARPGAPPLEQRIEAGKRSVFFAHHAHYAAATVSDTPGQEMASFDIASHHLLDTRLMMAWAKAFAEVGDLDRARHLAERLREFRNPASADFFAECDRAREAGMPAAQWPFQCRPPSKAFTWEDFLAENRARSASQ